MILFIRTGLFILALFGVLFVDKQEAAFASYRMFYATGCAIAFGYSYFLCVETKVYILAGVLLISLLLYSVIEMKVQLQSQHIKDIVALWSYWSKLKTADTVWKIFSNINLIHYYYYYDTHISLYLYAQGMFSKFKYSFHFHWHIFRCKHTPYVHKIMKNESKTSQVGQLNPTNPTN